MKKIIAFLVLGIFFYTNAIAQTLVAKTNRTEIPEGEAFLLTLDYDGNDSTPPDFNVLDRDFTIYSVTNAYQNNFFNGTMTQSRQWQVGLMPKAQAGAEVTIPPIKLGNIHSNPLTLKIVSAADLTHPNNSSNSGYQEPQSGPRFAVKGAVNTKTPYVQQQIDYTLTLFDTGGLQGSEPEFVDDGTNNWLIKSLGAPDISSKVVNGRSIREIKFHYAMFPQKSGKLKTPEIRFNGYYLTQNGRGSDPFEEIFGGSLMDTGIGFGSMFATRTPVVLNAKQIEIDVKPIPSVNNGNWWLPAESVKLYAEWNPQRPTFKVGEAVNRTIYLKAAGVVENQLPDIRFREVNGLKQYPEKAAAQNAIEGDSVVSIKKIANVYIPNKAGNMTIPEISVNWFNVKTGQMERAVLPAVNIQVQPADALTSQKLPQVSKQSQPQNMQQRGQILENAAAEAVDTLTDELPNIPESRYSAYYTAIAAFVLGLIISFMIFRTPKATRKPEAEKPNLRDSRKAVIRSAREKNFKALRDALLNWAQEKYKNISVTNMNDIVKSVNSKDFEKQIDLLTAELYGKGTAEWNSDAFIEVFEKADAKKLTDKTSAKPLPNLYK